MCYREWKYFPKSKQKTGIHKKRTCYIYLLIMIILSYKSNQLCWKVIKIIRKMLYLFMYVNYKIIMNDFF